jgi:transcription termination factor NusB
MVISKGFFAELNLTEDQIKVFKNHGITEDRTFNDPFLKPTEKDTDKLDFYMARTFSIDIKGKKSIPSVNDVLKKMEAQNQEGGKKKKEMQGLPLQMANYITDLMAKIVEKKMTLNNVSAKLEEYLNGELKSVKKELQRLRMILAVIKMGKILSNTWFDGLNLTDTGDYTFSKDSETMIIKLDRKKVYF